MNPGGRRLKQWLIEQIDSNIYNGLLWEDENRTMFRIPWKHAGKQDYNQEVDASIFKAWAIFKGKFKEGDKAEPATWKTRLRCALNKSPDFEEVTDRSQLDISEPYKVYRIVPEEEQKSAVVHQDPAGTFNAAFSQMMICFYYGGRLVGSTVTTHPEGCRISPCQPPLASGFLYGPDSLQNIRFPSADLIENERQRHITLKLFSHLERGILLRANREGIFIKRLCQSRVFWSGQDPQYNPNPCKLERDAVVKIFDTARFLQVLQLFQEGHYQSLEPTVTLCFGEEFNDFSTVKSKLIIVQITALNCQQLVDAVTARRSQYSSGNLEISDDMAGDQMARIYQDLCSYPVPQRASCFRDNLPIPV
ncbi:interferon regulatory factor 8-like isoform X2 [Sinocyclocheilus anshuiensis]|uniref:interferon regulatory factor 8-like isoform X2 n=1 Tax=Sinocyclocheilus anshuiensis TaxID=1608454 RepID=UPI0007B902A9|nr:PREDICTED: interferon regulatory factor 8-like isoform X2 [Sinocyclocheilus anshuiensis]